MSYSRNFRRLNPPEGAGEGAKLGAAAGVASKAAKSRAREEEGVEDALGGEEEATMVAQKLEKGKSKGRSISFLSYLQKLNASQIPILERTSDASTSSNSFYSSQRILRTYCATVRTFPYPKPLGKLRVRGVILSIKILFTHRAFPPGPRVRYG